MNALPSSSQFDPANAAQHYKAVRARLVGPADAIPPLPIVKAITEQRPFIIKEIDGYKRGNIAMPVTPKLVIETASKIYGVKASEITGPRKFLHIINIRMICYFVCYEAFPSYSLGMIGRFFGNRDHTTILHGVEKIRREISLGKIAIPEPLLALVSHIESGAIYNPQSNSI